MDIIAGLMPIEVWLSHAANKIGAVVYPVRAVEGREHWPGANVGGLEVGKNLHHYFLAKFVAKSGSEDGAEGPPRIRGIGGITPELWRRAAQERVNFCPLLVTGDLKLSEELIGDIARFAGEKQASNILAEGVASRSPFEVNIEEWHRGLRLGW